MLMRRLLWTCIAAVLLLVAGAVPTALAQRSGTMAKEFEGVSIDSRLGNTIPMDVTFRNEQGEPVALRQYFDGDRPVLLNLAYHNCPMLCGLMVTGLTETLRAMKWTPGDEFDVLTVSFNHREGPVIARKKKAHYLNVLGKPAAADGWHFLTGDQAAIKQLTDAVGFEFKYVEEKQQYAHPTAAIFLSGTGTVTRYIYGMEVEARDARKALVEASNGNVGSPVDQVLMYCFQFDPDENTYTADAFNLMKIGGVLTMILLGGTLYLFWRREGQNLKRTVAAS